MNSKTPLSCIEVRLQRTMPQSSRRRQIKPDLILPLCMFLHKLYQFQNHTHRQADSRVGEWEQRLGKWTIRTCNPRWLSWFKMPSILRRLSCMSPFVGDDQLTFTHTVEESGLLSNSVVDAFSQQRGATSDDRPIWYWPEILVPSLQGVSFVVH